ncbi:MAG: phytanoyl-CoA dioxygenase family protein [Actinomycetota bacterium]|nr:phytanoyl-CoA dioxygenase family protein [Actinomycetota bacterium]
MDQPLTDEQIAFFKANGYLILRGAMDPALCDRTEEKMWNELPGHVPMVRDDPATHVGPFDESSQSDDPLHVREGYRWQIRTLGPDPDVIETLFCPPVVDAAESLLGEGRLVKPIPGGSAMGSSGPAWPGGPVDPSVGVDGVRGIYCTLPYGDVPRKPDQAHTDGTPIMIGAVGLIDDVLPDGGAFKVWPGSHRRLYPLFWMQYDQARIPYYPQMPSFKGLLNPPEYHEELARIMDDTEPVDCWGAKGDVVLWHYRLAHMASHNYSPQMRKAILGDFVTTDLDQLRADPPQQNMWRDWSDRVNAVDQGYSAEFAASQGMISTSG